MRKLLAGLTVLAFVCIASSAMAAGVKVPKTLCLSHLFEAKYYQLVIKSQGSIPDTGWHCKIILHNRPHWVDVGRFPLARQWKRLCRTWINNTARQF